MQGMLARQGSRTGCIPLQHPACWVTKWVVAERGPLSSFLNPDAHPLQPQHHHAIAVTCRSMSMVPPPSKIGLNEMLIRMGAAGVRGAQTSGSKALVQWVTPMVRKTPTGPLASQYQAQMDALAKGKDKKDAADDQDTQNRIGQIDEALFDMDRAMGFLTEEGSSVTGLLDSTLFAAFDRATGNPDRARRLLLEKLRVDDALLRIAQTKGAISNKEMDLFLAPAPSLYDDESVWVQWITDRDGKHSVQSKPTCYRHNRCGISVSLRSLIVLLATTARLTQSLASPVKGKKTWQRDWIPMPIG